MKSLNKKKEIKNCHIIYIMLTKIYFSNTVGCALNTEHIDKFVSVKVRQRELAKVAFHLFIICFSLK